MAQLVGFTVSRYEVNMNVLAKLWLSLFLSSGLLGFGQAAREPGCSVSDLRIEPSEERHVFTVTDIQFDSDDDSSYAEISLKNVASKPISDILLLVEFQSSDGSSITVPIHGHTNLMIEKEPYDLWTSGDPIISDIMPEAANSLRALLPLRLASCPVHAQINLAEVQFADGTTFKHARAWRVDAMPMSPITVSFPEGILPTPPQVLATVEIDAEGKLALKQVQSGSAPIDAWLRRVVSTWSFQPAMRNGERVPSQQKWLIRFHRAAELGKNPEPVNVVREGVFAVVDFAPREGDSTKPAIVAYGGHLLSP